MCCNCRSQAHRKNRIGKDVDKEMADTDTLLDGLDLLLSNFEPDNFNLYNQYLGAALLII